MRGVSINKGTCRWRWAAVAVLLSGAACGKADPTLVPSPDAGAEAGIDPGPPPPDAGDDTAVPVPPAPPFTIDALSRVGIGSENSTGWPHQGRVYADVDWKEGPFARVILVVELESSCFPFEKWLTNRPPAGQNWPADCDAFDRNFNAFIDDAEASVDDEGSTSPPRVPFEIMHAITPFGGPARIEVDITDLANALPGKHRLRVDLVSYSDATGVVTGSNAGWTVSAKIDVSPGAAPHRVLAAVPLFAGQVQAGDPWPVIPFDVPVGSTGGRIEYRTSGHGQGMMGPRCIGPAEEFCDRRHLIFVDAAEVANVGLFRENCAELCTTAHQEPAGVFAMGFDYCKENPGGLPASVRASRANWCPGSMTPPLSWSDIAALAAPGPHTFSFQVSQILAGGNWLVSAIYYAYGS